MIVETSLGPVLAWGRVSNPPTRPAVFAIGGAFPPRRQLGWMSDDLPGLDVVRVNLPGMSPSGLLDEPGVMAAAAAFAEVIAQVLPDRPVTALGLSAGSLPALALAQFPAARIERLVLVEPFLQPAKLAPLTAFTRQFIAVMDGLPALRQWAEDWFGHEVGEPDYRSLLDHLPARTDVIVGDLPLDGPLPEGVVLPSLVIEEERALWRAQPGVRLHVLPGIAHDVPAEAIRVVLRDVFAETGAAI